jgi:hypothetical protein
MAALKPRPFKRTPPKQHPREKGLRENSRILEARVAHRRSLGFARDDNLVWER